MLTFTYPAILIILPLLGIAVGFILGSIAQKLITWHYDNHYNNNFTVSMIVYSIPTFSAVLLSILVWHYISYSLISVQDSKLSYMLALILLVGFWLLPAVCTFVRTYLISLDGISQQPTC